MASGGQSGAHLEPVRRALSEVREAPMDDAPIRGDDTDDRDDGGGRGGSSWRDRPRKRMPDDCPVVPVGTENGVYYFLDALGQLRELSADKVANKHIVSLFAPYSEYLREAWPRKTLEKQVTPEGKPIIDEDTGEQVKKWVTTGFRNDDCAQLLMDVCAEEGVWNARERVRGRGAWRDRDGGVVIHCGNHVLIGGSWQRPGLHDGMVYPTMPPIPKPIGRDQARVTGATLAPELASMLRAQGVDIAEDLSPAGLLFEFLKTWNWERRDLDPVLLLGFLGAVFMGGALDYRPLAWITGDAATGKTTLQKVIGLLTSGWMLQSPKASEAGVRQVLGQQSIGVGLDEAEAKPDNRKLLDLIELARLAATSQGNVLKGGQDHKGHEFSAEACFLFSSILIPPMPPADRSRIAMLELNELPKGARSPKLVDREIMAIGQWMLRRMLEAWDRWPAVLEEFQDALITVGGHKGRGADQFGTLLAAQHVLLYDDLPDPTEVAHLGAKLAVGSLAETADNENDAMECVRHLRNSLVQLPGQGLTKLVSEWIMAAAEPLPATGMGLAAQTGEVIDRRAAADKMLARIGMKVIGRDKVGHEGMFLAVASNHQGLSRQFTDTRWGGGTWAQALGRVPGAVKSKLVRIGGDQGRATLVPLLTVVPGLAGEDQEDDAAALAEAMG